MKKFFAVLIGATVFAMVIGLTGCSPTPAENKPAAAKVTAPAQPAHNQTAVKIANLKETDHNTWVVVAIGGDVNVTLLEDPSKQGKWFLEPQSALVPTNETKRTTSATEQHRIFSFHAHQAGQDYLVFTYKEGNTVKNTVYYLITVQ